MKYKNILLTGSSGTLGSALVNSGKLSSLLTPPSSVLDITEFNTIKKFFGENDVGAVIHCAAMARMAECQENPAKAIETNIVGTCNLAMCVIQKEKKAKKNIRFVHISTDGVYPGTKGNYSEEDATIPYNTYGWTKLGAECAVNLLKNFCIIRTNFFDPKKIKFKDSAIDAYTSKVTVNYLSSAIIKILESDFIGTVNIGANSMSDYDIYKKYKPSLKSCILKDILKKVPFAMASDSSMNCNRWKKINRRIE